MKPLQITIIGGGFCGIMTAINLVRNTDMPLHIHIINKGNQLAKGVAFNPHSSNLLLNVPAGKMSAFGDIPDDFTRWLKTKSEFKNQPEAQLAADFAPREQYGYYLTHLWQQAVNNKSHKIGIWVYDDEAYDIIEDGRLFYVYLKNNPILTTHFVVLATGNVQPRMPSGISSSFTANKNYFGNPWKGNCVGGLNETGDVLIIGNGLTMADTVLGLAERGFAGKIYTVSPHGYNLNPWHQEKQPYTGFNADEMLKACTTVSEMLGYVNKHRRAAKRLDESVYPIIDLLRPRVQTIWQSISIEEKRQFVKHLRQFWDAARHRLPVKMHQFIATLYAEGSLVTYKGTISSVVEENGQLKVDVNTGGALKQLFVQRVINCTGPENNPMRSTDLMKNMHANGVIAPDPLHIGINALPDGRVIARDGKVKSNMLVIGNNLKGVLWESTAVPELREQAKRASLHLIEKCESFVVAGKT